jgi:EAL domain-containing protein (putative c-di-GMP-specific phosphodiesterase class I)
MDSSFVHALHEGERAQALAAGIIGLSHNLGLRVIAEGIEERHQLLQLRELGCEQGQGNLLAPPAAEADIAVQTEVGARPTRRVSAIRQAISAV